MQFITLLDYLLLPVYLLIIYAIATRFRNRWYPEGHPWRKYFLPALSVKIGGALAIGMIYQYYYGGGDTSNFFYHAQVINSALSESPGKWINLVLHIPKWSDSDYVYYYMRMFWYRSLPEYSVCAIAAFIGFFTFTTYLPTAAIFAAISFTGVWALFRTFASQYPAYSKYIAICVLFIPSVALWGSGIFKDTICIGCLGWLTYCAFQMLVQRNFSFRNLLFIAISIYLISIIKAYIVLAFLPALALWIIFSYLHRIQSNFLRFLVRLSLVPLAIIGFVKVSNRFSDSLGKYSLQNVAQTSFMTRDWIGSISKEDASGYDLGAFDPSIVGMLKKFPAAVNVTLFRPYLWETKKIISFISAFEALAFLLLTLKVLVVVGPIRFWRAIATDPNIQFCLIFAIIFAFAVGISSFNFGALSRYKIQCLPFYAMAMVLIYYKYFPPQVNIFSLSFRRDQMLK